MHRHQVSADFGPAYPAMLSQIEKQWGAYFREVQLKADLHFLKVDFLIDKKGSFIWYYLVNFGRRKDFVR